MIRLTVPSGLRYRDLAIRMVWSACKLIPMGDEIRDAIISAFSEAFNNVVLHGAESTTGELTIEVEVELGDRSLTIRVMDFGRSFDPTEVPSPDLDTLPESGLGIFIMRSCMDRIAYASGAPNTLSMTKFLTADTGVP